MSALATNSDKPRPIGDRRGTCRSAGGWWQGLAGLRDDAPSEARSADGERAGRRPRAYQAGRYQQVLLAEAGDLAASQSDKKWWPPGKPGDHHSCVHSRELTS